MPTLKPIHHTPILQKLGAKFTWETLRAISQSNLGRATILAPLIGYLVIFNPNFSEFFRSALPADGSSRQTIAIEVHEFRLHFLYFGLIFIGLGAAAFASACPSPIRDFDRQFDYISKMSSIASASLISERSEEIFARFLHLNRGEDRSPFFSGGSLSFPEQPSRYVHDLVAEAVGKIESDRMLPPRSDEPVGSLFAGSNHVFLSGESYITTDEVLSRVFESGISAEYAFFRELRKRLEPLRDQVFFVDYHSANFQKFGVRMAIALSYFLGLALLLVPTITTSILVLDAALRF